MPVRVLETICNQKSAHDRRSNVLLKDPAAEPPEGWYMEVHRAFDDALDIRLTEKSEVKKKRLVWTQGSAFDFKAGDVVYARDDRDGIHCVQVQTAIPAGWIKGEGRRSAGYVFFDVFRPLFTRRFGCAMTQDQFVRFLIVGPEGDFENRLRL